MFRSLFGKSRGSDDRKIIVVSGLPRSGTSMMMKMLEAGGIPVVTDGYRKADEDNPNGYLEVELSKKLKDGESDWLHDAHGKAVKVISSLLEYMPDDLTYDILFMERDIHEILMSQKKMLDRRNETSGISDQEMEAQFQNHIKALKYWVARKPNMRVKYVRYNEMVNSPDDFCTTIADFLGLELDVQSMRVVPNQDLYRNRAINS